MRLLLAAVLTTAACAGSLPEPSTPLQYSCADHTLTRDGNTLAGLGGMQFVREEQGRFLFVSPDRFITVPVDPRRDAVEQVYAHDDETRIARSQVCRVRGGYSDMVVRYTGGESLEQLAKEETGGDRDAAYQLVRKGLQEQQLRLHRDQ